MRTTLSHASAFRRSQLESLERRLCLSCVGNSIVGNEVDRAVEAVNCFAYDLYEHVEQEEGNLFLSPLSIATALAMVYAGADGQTASEMENVLHLGSTPGVHDSFHALIESFQGNNRPFDVTLANALWPKEDFPFKEEYVQQIGTDYQGHTQNVDFSQTQQAADLINDWVDEQTRGRVTDLVSPSSLADVVMVLTNSIYFNAFWNAPFDPEATHDRKFQLESGESITVPTMYHQAAFGYTEIDGYEIVEMPFRAGASSMIVMAPPQGESSAGLQTDTLVRVSDWLATSPERLGCTDLAIPKFQTTVSTDLVGVLQGMGIRSAFEDADFSRMTDGGIKLGEVLHKATIEVNEQGTEAAAATSAAFLACFAAGTLVLTRNGETPIEDIQVGDLVLSRDEHNVENDNREQRVEEVFEGREEIIAIVVGDHVINTTAKHRFFAKNKGWTPAIELQSGDLLAADYGNWEAVGEIKPTGTVAQVYNFRVAKDHTYFVREKSQAAAIWTHNCYGPSISIDRPFHYLIRDNVTATTLFMGRVSDPRQTENRINPIVEGDAALAGDLDMDGQVNFQDFLTLSNNFGMVDAALADGDVDGNGVVDFEDFLALAANFGQSDDDEEESVFGIPDSDQTFEPTDVEAFESGSELGV